MVEQRTDINIHKIKNWKKRLKKHSPLGEVHEGGEGPHWTAVPSKKDEEEEEGVIQ